MRFAAKRFISIILVIVMCMQALPVSVFAALIDNDPEYNEEILDALTDLVGSEDEAERYYALLDHYGLLDEDGNLSESWEIWMDGEQVTLDDIIAELESEDCDLDKYVLVDGTAITLGNIKTILEIEEYIEYLQKTYFDGHQWTKEQQANLASLVEQMETKGIRLTSDNSDTEIVWPSGISHEAVVSFELEEKSDGTVVITALLDGAVEGQEVSFDYEALTGSQPVYGSGMIIMTADESGTASEQFVINKGDLEDNFHSSAQLTYFIKLSNLEGALFENGYPNTLITAYTAPNTDKALMQKVKNAAPGFVGKFNAAVSSDVQKKEYSFHDGDNGDYAYGTAIDWGILNNIHIVTKIELDYEKAGGGTWSIADMSFLENWGDVNGRWYGATGRYKATLRGQTDAVVWQNADILVSANSRQLSMNILDYGSDYNQPLSEIMRTNKVLSVEARAVIDYMIDKSGSNYYRTDIAERTPRYAKPDYELRLYNAVDPWVNGISQHSQTGYAPGHYIPVVVQFNQIVDPNVTLTLNGEKYKSLESKESGVYTSTLTYLYEVKDVDDLNLYCEVGSFTSISGATNDTYTDDNGITMVWGTNIDTPYKPDAITEVSAEVTGDVADPVLEVSVGITDDEGLTQWIGVSEDENGKLYADGLSVSVDGGETLHNLYFESESFSDGLYADIPLDIASDRCDYVVELFLDNDLIVGKYASGSHSWAIELIEEADLTATLNVGSFFDENEENPVIFVEGEMGKIKATFELADGEYSFCDTSKVAVYGTEEAESADFVWKSSNTAVATIDDNGNVTPTGATGTTQITLTARNGGFGNNEVTVTATYVVGENTFDALNFKAGLSPFFTIPHDKLTVVDGKNAIVYWSSNITDKNGDEETTFDISVTLDGNDVYSMAVSGTVSEPHSFAEIPGEYLIYDYTGTSNTYEITVACEYSGVTYSDTASVTIEPLPAGVALAKLDSYYILDTAGTLPISWSVENLSRAEEDSLDSIFDFTVMRNNVEVENDVVLSLNNGSGSGIFNLTIEDIIATPDEPGSYREVYTVTIQAKNGTDSTWSYDSFLLYVYDEDALQIMVDGEKAQDSLFISNRETISSMSQEEILELERDIYLKNIISVNYGDYAWTEVADQIMWRSDKNSVATLNYQQGMMYNNIEDFSYTSYRPTTELGLSGLSGGSSLISAIHKLTGMEDTLDVTVETLEDKLYLLKCFPKARTKLQYKNAEDGDWITVYSDNNGEAAIYEPGGIKSNIYCFADVDTDNNPATPTIPYIGIFYLNELETGEGDWTKLERYPLNNLNLHRAGYAYLYLKDENGAPYTGDIAVRAGIYVDGEYIDNAQFGFNKTVILESGEEDNIITLDKTGKLSVYMDSKAWGLDEEWLTEQNQVDYVFEIRALTEEIVEQEPDESGETSDEGSESSDEGGDVPVTRLVENNNYYPILYTVDATTNSDIYVGSGKAVVSFRLNETEEPHQFIAAQNTVYTGAKGRSSVLGSNSKIGPNNNFKESALNTSVMWWGTEIGENPTLQLVNENDVPVCTGEGAYKIVQTPYEFTKFPVTNYSVTFNENTLEGIGLTSGKSTGLSLDFYSDGENISRHEILPFRLINLIGVGNVEDAKALPEMLTNLGMSTDTNNKKSMDFGDQFVNVAMNFVATDSYSTGDSKLFSIQISPTSDPTKFLGFIEVNVGNMDEEEEPEQIFFVPTQFTSDEYGTDVGYTPGLNELMLITERKTMDEYLTPNVTSGTVGGDNMTGERNLSGKFSGYMESLIYFDENSGEWEIQILNGGFELGAGASYTWTWNTTTGIVPTTMTLTIGGALEIGLDTLTVSYFNVQEDETGFGTDYLTELRIMLYVEFFAGVGFDYAVCAFKLGIFGRVTLDMRFQWLNRPYMDVEDDIYNVADGTHNDSYYEEITDVYGAPMGYWKSPNSKLDGQRFKADGQIGLKLVVRVLFISFEKVLFSFHFNLFDETTRDWETIQTNWEKNKAAQMSAISALLGRRSVSVSNVGGQQVISLNLAPTLESRDYVEQGSYWNDGSVSLFALDENNALQNLQYNSYPYANPVVSDDGAIVAFLSDMGSENVEDTKASFATRNEFGMYNEGEPIYNGDGYGDAQLALAGTGEFAVAAWARQTESVKKDAGSVLTAEDQIIMMNSSEIYAGVYDGNEWATTRLTNNQSSDVAPVVSANGNRAVVAWREVASSAANTTEDGLTELTSFTEKDMILYRIYDGEQWSEAFTLYNGTSGAVKGISAAMLKDGTAAITYTLDTDGDEVSITDRDVFYAVIDNDTGYVERTVRATNDAYLDENPLVTAVTFPNANDEEYFVLGWFSQQAVAKDTAAAMSNGASQTENDVLSDIRLMAFDGNGIYAPLMPDSISQAADAQNVEITSSFRFSKNSETINDLSILWVQRARELSENNAEYLEKDVLKAVKFYTFGQNDNLIGFTGAIDVAEMDEGTLIDHFDAYVSNPETNEIKAVILGTTYGADGVVTVTGETVGGDIVEYSVPSSTTSMYTATEVYQDKIAVSGVLADYETVKKGNDTEIMFAVKNNGIHAVSGIEITLNDGKGESQTTTFTNINLLPGGNTRLYANYNVPADEVVDLDYTVKATFDESEGAYGSAQTTETVTYRFRTTTQDLTTVDGTVYLDLPEVQITDAEIIRESDGYRKILVKLNNGLDASLAKDGRAVKVSFYSDSAYENPIDSAYISSVMIDDADELIMIDEGGYSAAVDFNIKEYLTTLGEEELQEIPAGGINVYIKAEALEKDDNGEYAALPDIKENNNYSNVLCESLWNGTDDVEISYIITKSTDECDVAVTVRNTRIGKEIPFSNIVVKLYDADRNMLAQKVYNPDNNGKMSYEERITANLTFGNEAKNAAFAEFEIVEFDTGDESRSNSKLAYFQSPEIPGLSVDSFILQENGTYRCDISYSEADSINLILSTQSHDATIYFSGDTGSHIASAQKLIEFPSEYPVFDTIFYVTAPDGNTTTYTLRIDSSGTPQTEYTVFFNSAEGSGTMEPEIVSAGSSYTLPECTFNAPEGFNFKAWSINGVEYPVNATVEIKGNTTVKAVWTNSIMHSVILDDGNGAIISTRVIEGERYQLPDVPFNNPVGKKFDCWSIGGERKQIGEYIVVTKHVTATAVWMDKSEFIIHHWRNGGEGEMDNVTVFEGGSYILPECAFTAPKGFKFKAWDIDGIEYTVGTPVTVTDHLTLTAVWMDKSEFIIHHLRNGGEGEMDDVTVFEGDTYILPECAFTAPNGFKFKGWSIDNEEYPVGANITITDSITVAAVWMSKDNYLVTFDANGGSGSMSNVDVYEGEGYILPECAFTAPEDFKFKAWDIDGIEYTVGATVTVTDNTTVKAVWMDKSEFIIHHWRNGGEGEMDNVTVFEGGSYILPECAFTAPEGFKFKGWSIDDEEYPVGATVTVTDHLTLTAVWMEKDNYLITFDANGGSGSMSNVDVYEGEGYILPECTLTAPEGYKFMAWSIDGVEKAVGAFVDITKDTTVKALWTLKEIYTVTFDANGADGNVEPVTAAEGDSYTLPDCIFDAPYGFKFKTWSVNGKEMAAGEAFTVTGNTVVKSEWIEKTKYTITFEPGSYTGLGAASGTMNPVTVYEDENLYTLPQCGYTAPVGCRFAGWDVSLEGGHPYTYDAGDTIELTANAEACPAWEIRHFSIFVDCPTRDSIILPQRVSVLTKVSDVKRQISSTAKIPVENMVLSYAQKELDNDATLKDCGILNAASLQLVVEHTVTFAERIGLVGNNGKRVEIRVPEGEYTLPEYTDFEFTPPEGDVFTDWLAEGYTHLPGDTIEITSDIVIYATYGDTSDDIYGIHFFDSIDGYDHFWDNPTEFIDTQYVQMQESFRITPPAAPEKAGYVFDGWYFYDFFSSERFTDIAVETDKDYDFDYLLTYGTQIYAKYTPFELTVEESEAGYTATSLVGEIKEDAKYSWYHYKVVENSTVTDETVHKGEASANDGTYNPETLKWTPRVIVEEIEGETEYFYLPFYFTIDLAPGDVLIITPDDPEDFAEMYLSPYENTYYLKDYRRGNTFIFAMAEDSPADAYTLYSYSGETDDAGAPMASTTPIYAELRRYEVSEPVEGETDAVFGSGIVGEEYFVQVEYSDGTVVTSKPFIYEIVSASYEVGGVNDSYVYTGSQIMPEPVVTVTINDITGEPTVLDKADYEVIYGNNTTVAEGGYVTVKIKDKENEGKYIDIKTLYFDITEREQQAFNIDGAISATYGDDPVTLNAQGGSGNGEITWRITSGSEFAEISPNGDNASLNITGAGTVVIEAVKASDGNYSAAVDTHSVVISKADVTADLFTLTPPTDAIYSRSLKKASVTGSGEYGAITVRYYSDQALKNAANPVNVGTYYVGITTTGGENYNAVNVPMYVGSFDITEKTITVTADAKQRQYGNPNPVLTYKTEGLIDGDRLSGALTTTAYITSEVGEYEITQGSLTAGDNYIIDFESALLTITKSGKLTSPPISGRHSDNGSTYTYTVTKVAGAEYRMNGGEWQDSNIFADLTANQKYTFSIRLKETDNFEASDERSLTVDLGKIDGVGSVTILDWTYGEIASTPVIASTTNGIDNVTYLYESTDGKGYTGESQPVNAGTYRLTVTFAATDTHNEAKASADFTIFKAIPDITAPTNLTATYGDTIASVQLPEGWEWNVTDTAETVGNAGDNSFSVIYTHPENPDNYNQVTDEVTITVAPKTLTATVVLDAYSFVYSGSEHKPGVTVKDGEDVIPSGEYTVSYTNNVNSGTATVSITDVDGGNYTVSGSTSFEITKKTSVAIPGVEREFIRTVASAGNEINIEEMLPDDHGNVSYRLSDSSYTVLENVSISTDGKLVFDTKTSDASASDTITVVVEMQNYTDVTVTVSVILNEKTTQSITGVSAAEGLVYNKNAQQGYTGIPTSEKYTGDYEITYTGRNNSYNSTVAPTNAGDYTVTFKIPDSELYYSGNVSINFTIAKAKAEISVDTAPIVSSYGEQLTLPTAITNFGTVSIDKAPADMTEVGEYTVTYTVADNENYNGDTKTVKVTIVPKKITRPAQASAVTYTGDALTYAVIETDDYTVTNGVQTNANEDGYNVIIALKDKENTVWDDGTVTDLTHKFIINRKAIEAVAGVPAPVATQNAQTTVNGENYSGAAKWNPDVDTFGYFTAYDVTLTLTANANYKFADTITLDGYSVSTNNGTTLVLTKTFDKTAKAKITSVTAPTVDKLAVYGTLEDALSVMPNTVIAVTEAGNTTLPIVWAVVGEYDKTPGVSNIFKWTASVGDYDANSQTLTGDITVENADALGVVNTGTPAEITYDGNTYDVSTLFTKDTNAGGASYEIVVLGTEGEGAGALGNDGKTLTVTKAGVITVKMTTAANGAYAQGTAQTTLTVKLGTGVGNVTIEGWTYGEGANAPIVTSETNGTDNVTYLYESTDDKGYNSNAAPTIAGAYKVTATFAATDLYVKAEDSAEFTIEKAQPTVKTPPAASRVKKGNLLSSSTLTGGEMLGVDGEALDGTFAWKTPEKEMNTRGNIEVTAVFTPNDTENYKTADVTLTVEVYTTSTGSSGISVTTYYDIKFNTNGGSNVPAQSIRRNSTATEPQAPTKDGYTFEGWYTDAECTKAYDFDTKVTNDITLYAKWIENKPVLPDECDGTSDDNCPSLTFTDLDTNAWYHLDVDYVIEKGLMNGIGESIFAPNGNLSRAMLVTILWRLEGKPQVNYFMTFEDVEAESWYGEAVRWAASEKIVLGHSAESFAPDDDITREQIAAIMHRYAKFKGCDVSVGENTNILSYDDALDISEYAIASMQYAVGSGLIKGKSESTLNPLDNATRAEIAAILHRFIEENK